MWNTQLRPHLPAPASWCLVLCLLISSTAWGEPVRIGVLAKRGEQHCLAQWNPTAQYLTETIPNETFIILPLGFDEIRNAVNQERVDFILANSSFYVDLEMNYGVRRIATLKNLSATGSSQNYFAGVIFCRADNPDIHNIQDLKNKNFMAVDPMSLGGWHMAWRALLKEGINPTKHLRNLSFGGFHDAVVFAVRDGKVDAGTVRSDTMERMALEGQINLEDFRIISPHQDQGIKFNFLHSTRHYPEWPMAKAPHTSDLLAEKVAVSLIQMPPDCPAAQAGQCAGWTIPLNYRPVHECLMDLRLTPYENYGKVTLGDIMRQYGFWLLGTIILSLLIVFFFLRLSRMKVALEQSVKARKERERARLLLQTVLDSMPSGVIIIEAETRKIREVNPAAARMIGLEPSEIIGHQCHSFLCPGKMNQCPILDFDQNMDNTEQILLTGSGVEIPILKTVVPLVLEGKEHLLESFFDLTERKLAEAEKERLVLAVQQVKESVVVTDTDGNIQFVNSAFETITGYSSQEVMGKNTRILKSGSHDDLFYQKLWNTLISGETWLGRLINKKKDGTGFTEEVSISPVRNSAGQTVNYVAVKRDITDEIRKEEHFHQAQKMESIGRLAGGMAHDFNNMLGVILGYADMALEEIDPTLSLHQDLQEIKTAAERSADLTSQLLAFARKQTVTPKVLDLNHTLSSLLNMVRRLIGENIELDWLPDPDIWAVNIDPSQVNQILINLCVNSRDAITGTGKIIIETANVTFDEAYMATHTEVVLGQFVQLIVSDDGSGINKETQKKIFEPFFTTKDIGEGTGLGLSTVYGIVKQNNGFINVYSEENHGTTFRIYLPRSDQSLVEISPDEDLSHQKPNQETILVVEDEPALLKLASTMLSELNYKLLTASTPSDAIQIAEETSQQIDMLLTDVVMPEMNGRDLAKNLMVQRPGLKTLFMSGYTSNIIAHHGVLDEGVHFLAKPFVMKDLTVKIRDILDNE